MGPPETPIVIYSRRTRKHVTEHCTVHSRVRPTAQSFPSPKAHNVGSMATDGEHSIHHGFMAQELGRNGHFSTPLAGVRRAQQKDLERPIRHQREYVAPGCGLPLAG